MKNLIDFTGKHMLVIGASSGIGQAAAVTLSKLGAHVDVMARNMEGLQETLSLMEGNRHACYQLNVTDFDSISEVIRKAVAEHGAYDGLVYSVGVALNTPLAQITPVKMQWVFNTNVFGFVETVRQISKKGRFNPGMRIVGVSSVASIRGDISQTAYSASKAAMDGAIRSMAGELARKEICINTVAPSMINTRMYQDYLRDYGTEGLRTELMIKRQLRGIGEPQDVANAIAFLLSPAARMITATCMPVDGGYRA